MGIITMNNVQGGMRMKKEILFLISVFFFMSMTAISGVYAVEENNKIETILEKKADITGDGVIDSVSVKGMTFSEPDSPFSSIYLEIEDSNKKKQKVKIDGGFNPQLIIHDLNNDGKKDMLISVGTDGESGISDYYLYTFENSKVIALSIPEPLVIQSEFLDRYRAKINIENNHKTHKFNLKSRAENYEQTGIYHNGALNEPTELIIESYAKLEPIKVKGGKMGLKGTQTISGAYSEDEIGRIDSTWFYKNGQWKLLGTKVLEIPYEKGKD